MPLSPFVPHLSHHARRTVFHLPTVITSWNAVLNCTRGEISYCMCFIGIYQSFNFFIASEKFSIQFLSSQKVAQCKKVRNHHDRSENNSMTQWTKLYIDSLLYSSVRCCMLLLLFGGIVYYWTISRRRWQNESRVFVRVSSTDSYVLRYVFSKNYCKMCITTVVRERPIVLVSIRSPQINFTYHISL